MDDNRKKIDSYRTLIAYQKSACVFDITVYFVNRFLDRAHDRTVDQMQQAARSGKANIVEGYSDAEGSTESEHKLTVIAKGSLEELKEDYLDYLRTHELEIWGPKHEKYILCQQFFRRHNDPAWYMRQVKGRGAEEICNMALIVIYQALALIRGLIDYQDRKFLEEGGIKEQRYRARSEYRERYQGYRNGGYGRYGGGDNGRWDRDGRDGSNGRKNRDGSYNPTEPTPPTKPTPPTDPTLK